MLYMHAHSVQSQIFITFHIEGSISNIILFKIDNILMMVLMGNKCVRLNGSMFSAFIHKMLEMG